MNVRVLIPLYNDWEACSQLVRLIDRHAAANPAFTLSLTIVDDGSTVEQPAGTLVSRVPTEILHLSRNVGHQRALAIGLAYLAETDGYDAVVVMDADGEDKPEHIAALVACFRESPRLVTFARRGRRDRSLVFQVWYACYRLLFQTLTGESIAFGNFSVIPRPTVRRVVWMTELWTHMAAAIMRSRVGYGTIRLERGTRLADRSKMTFTGLVRHGLDAIVVYADHVASRMLVASAVATGASVIALLAALLWSGSLPAWVPLAMVGLSMLSVQGLLLSLFLIFIVDRARSQDVGAPAERYRQYVLATETLECLAPDAQSR